MSKKVWINFFQDLVNSMRYIVKTMGLVVCTKVLFLPFLPPPLLSNRLKFQYTPLNKTSKGFYMAKRH